MSAALDQDYQPFKKDNQVMLPPPSNHKQAAILQQINSSTTKTLPNNTKVERSSRTCGLGLGRSSGDSLGRVCSLGSIGAVDEKGRQVHQDMLKPIDEVLENS